MYGIQKSLTFINCRQQFIFRFLGKKVDTKCLFHPSRRRFNNICVRYNIVRNVSAAFSSQASKNKGGTFKDKKKLKEENSYFYPVLKPNRTQLKSLKKDKTSKNFEAFTSKMTENEHFRSVMNSKPVYDKYLAKLHQQSKLVDLEHVKGKITKKQLTLPEQFRLLKDLASLSFKSKKIIFCDKMVLYLLEDFVRVLPRLSHDQFVLAMKSFGTFDIRSFMPYMSFDLKLAVTEISTRYERECIQRAHSWDIGTLLIAADLFYTLNDKYYLSYPYLHVCWPRIETLLEKDKPEKDEVVAVLFHANLGRRTSWNMRDLLKNALDDGISEEFSVDECGIVCAGFHKANHPVTSQKFILDTILKIKKNIREVNEISVCAIFKAFSRTFDKGLYRSNPEVFSALKDLTDYIADEFDRLSFISLVRIIKFYHDILLSSIKLETAFINRVTHIDFNTLRSKEWSKTSFLLGALLLDFNGHEDVFKTIETKFLHQYVPKLADDEHDLHNVIRCLTGMSYLNYYPEDLVDKCFSKEIFGDLGKIRDDTKSMLFQLHQSMKIERPNYKGNLLSESVYSKIQKEMESLRPVTNFFAGAKNSRENLLRDVQLQLGKMFGRLNCLNISYLLPHFDLADIEMYFDDIKGPVRKINSTSDHKRVVICVHGMNSFYRVKQDDGSYILKLGGRYNIRQRQLEKIADVLIPISEIDYKAVEDKRKYLLELLAGKINIDFVKKEKESSQMLLDLLNSRKTKKQK